ncbi:DUF3515 domain-containing protein [Mycolicibacillus parakoreensis]|uniref:DUF3515 domain-containing protein n=1 Tax=Mycolicibacillus parakoreensis TaxID=1069221 RepID=A0ABY3U2G3_9MYCO|nr:DUF3515 domain-containing protein [Mycolicibacillus parakoreensis]MCV7315832.1 DUF3515 domain-containing protein [Mycolicibacillus parakoreensis]ULN51747.1 DUF3515 domain-containing protein [Mycolicibacillus parakoreensis]HLR98287.1 DUF3515 domain-containing protein [Mycolicibacillus parakoreensis]
MDEPDGPPRWALITALVVAVAAVLTVLVVAATRHTPRSPVPIAAVPAPAAAGPDCAGLLEHLPDRLGDFTRAPVAEPAPPGVAAWRAEDIEDPVVLRCGLARPAEFVVGSPIQVVDAVQWFAVRETERVTWFAVDRPVYVALTLPAGSGPSPIQQVSAVIAARLAARPIDPAPVG